MTLPAPPFIISQTFYRGTHVKIPPSISLLREKYTLTGTERLASLREALGMVLLSMNIQSYELPIRGDKASGPGVFFGRNGRS